MEWWYVNCHLTVSDGRTFGVFAAFFRVDISDGAPDKAYQHFLTWALIDPGGQRYFPHTLLDPQAAELALKELDRGRGPRDERLSRALREVLVRGHVPLPDRQMRRVQVDLQRLALDLDGNRFTKNGDGSYALELKSADGREACRLQFSRSTNRSSATVTTASCAVWAARTCFITSRPAAVSRVSSWSTARNSTSSRVPVGTITSSANAVAELA